MSVAFQKVNVRCFQGHGNTIVFDREMFGVQFLKDGIHCRSEQRLIQRFDKVAECNAISLHSVLMPLRDKYHQRMLLHLNQRLRQLKTVGWHLDIEKKQIKGFAGRNFEYYSEDGFLSGSMSAATVGAAEKNGMYCYIKHFALNERETWRHYGLCTWADEQAMREIYFMPFEKAVKEGGSTAVMSSYNNIGTTWAGASTALLTNVLRNEWGFIGTVITDNNEEHGFMDIEKAVLAGGTNLLFGWGTKTFDNLSQTATGQLKMREAAHQYLYTLANSYGVDVDAPVPMWRTPALVGSVIVYVLVLAGVVVILRRRKYNKTLANTNAGADVSKE